jgi:hypothetical protein
MMRLMTTTAPSRWTALVVATSLLMPALAGCGSKGGDTSSAPSGSAAPAPQMAATPQTAPATAKPGLSTKQKVVLLAGAALLFYIYQKDKSNNAKAAAAGSAKPQLFQEGKGPNKGAIYYHDPSDPTHKKIIWLTAPSGQVQVPADSDALAAQQQYGNQPAPPVPAGDATVPATQYDPSLANPGGPTGPSGPPGPAG